MLEKLLLRKFWKIIRKTSLVEFLLKNSSCAIHSPTLSIFKFAQYYFSRGFEFARFKFMHPNWIYSSGLKFSHLICGKKREKRSDYPL